MTSTDSLPVPGTQATGTGRYQPRIGSMCTGYGGLDMAVQEVLCGTVAWHADPDPGASAVLAHHWPAGPNLGDITAVDWLEVEPVDIVTAGFPCQDISYAGRGEGIQEGNRSGLWHTIADALGALRPRIVVLENVRAIVVRRPGLDVVLADLARLGFDAEWVCARASDVGAPHRRERWFLVACHPDRMAWPEGGALDRRPGPVDESRAVKRAVRSDRAPAADTDGNGLAWPRESGRCQVRRDAPAGSCEDAPADPNRDGFTRLEERDLRSEAGLEAPHRDDPDGRVLDWRRYGPSIERWEHVTGRPAPHPTEPTPRGGDRLSPRFVEWMQGLTDGHVTSVADLSRNQMLRLLGNGVVRHGSVPRRIVDQYNAVHRASTDGTWRERAACRDEDPELFFPIGEGRGFQQQIERVSA